MKIQAAKTNGSVLLCSPGAVDQEGFACRQYHSSLGRLQYSGLVC